MRQIDTAKIYKTKNCLVIDDMSEVRGSLTRTLQSFGILNIDTAANGDDAIEKCQNKHYDIVLCDYNLGPGKDGQQVLEELRFRKRLNNTSMFLMITAETTQDMVLGALEYQPDDYIAKPYTPSSLRKRMDRALARNQELYGVKEALDEKNYRKAIDHCDRQMNNDTPYHNSCLQIKAEMYLRLLQPQKAQDIYEGMLEKRPLTWAKLGMGKSHLAKKEYPDAEVQLKEVIDIDRRFVEAYDLLAQSYLARGDSLKAQKATQAAAEVSPKSVLRQRRLADLANKNGDVETSLAARRRTIRLGQNSCHESTDDYLNLTRELAEQTKDNLTTEGKELAKEAFDTLKRLKKKKYYDSNADIQSKSLKSRVSAGQHQQKEADEWMAAAREAYIKNEGFVSPEASLDFVKSMLEAGDKEGADTLLKNLVKEHAGDERIVEKFDAMSDSPISPGGRKKVAELAKNGIGHYEKKEFPKAITTFKNAVSIFPNHVGLNLNLVQATIAEATRNGDQPGFKNTCHKALKVIGNLSEGDPQHSRHLFLLQQVNQFYPK